MWRHISIWSGKCLSITESNIPWCQPLCRGSASPRVGAGGGLASPGYKMISLGYKFQAETPAARSPPPLPSCYNPSPSSPILFHVFSLFPSPSHSLSAVLLHSFSFIFRLFRTFTSPTTSKTCTPENISATRPQPNKQNIQIIFHILFLPSRQSRVIFKIPLGFVSNSLNL